MRRFVDRNVFLLVYIAIICTALLIAVLETH